jgi:toxin YoeB
VKLIFSGTAWDDYLHWQATDPKLVARINDLVRDAMRRPVEGTGKPEPLRGNLTGWWSRRIDRKHRLVYRVAGTGNDQALQIAQCRFHY